MISANTPRLVVKVAWRNVRRNWRHSVAALATMTVGFLALALFQGYIDALLRMQLDLVYSRMMIGDMQVQRHGAGRRAARSDPEKYWMDEAEQRFVESWIAAHKDEVRTRVRTLIVVGMAHAGGSSARMIAWGHDIPEGRIARGAWAWNTWAGHPQRDDERTAAVLGIGFGEILGCEPIGDEPVFDARTATPLPVERPFRCKQPTITLTVTSRGGRNNAVDAEVVGLSRSPARDFDEQMLWLPLAFTQDLASTRGVSQYMIWLQHPKDAPRVRAELRGAAQAAGVQLDVEDWLDTEGADILRRGIDLLSMFRALVFIVILVIAGAAVLTTMMKQVRERTREIGTLRSLGYRRPHLLSMFAVEAAVLALYAAAAGLLTTLVATAALNATGITYKGGLLADAIPLRVGYAPWSWLWGSVFLSAVAVAAALLAARRATAMSIAEALSDG